MHDVCLGVKRSWAKSVMNRKNFRGKRGGKKQLLGFFIKKDGTFYRKPIKSRLKAWWMNLHKWYKVSRLCIQCNIKFIAIVKHKKDPAKCPVCGLVVPKYIINNGK